MMKDNQLHTPDGFRDFLPKEYVMKRETENKLMGIFQSYGYAPVASPSLEYLEVFEGKSSVSRQMYRFIDRDGDMLVLRPDMTPPIARIAATNFFGEDIPLRFCYIEKVFRYQESFQGKTREFTQAGLELIGNHSLCASGEVIAIAIQCLLAAGLRDFRVDIGQAGVLRGALDETELDQTAKETLMGFILKRNYVAVEEYISKRKIPNNIRTLLSDLALLTGDVHILKTAKGLVRNQAALDALHDLEDIYKILISYGLEEYVLFDLSMTGHSEYYTGIIFRGYAYGTGFSILDGGRYDNLIARFGEDLPSVGFAIKVDDLLSALSNQNISFSYTKAETLLAYTDTGRNAAMAVGNELRRQGVAIENSLLGDDLDKNIAYAKRKKLGGILYFLDDKHGQVVNLESGEMQTVEISKLLQGECDMERSKEGML